MRIFTVLQSESWRTVLFIWFVVHCAMCSHQHSPLSHHIHNKVHLLLRGFEPKSNLVQYSFLRRFLSKLFISRDGRALFFISALALFALFKKALPAFALF